MITWMNASIAARRLPPFVRPNSSPGVQVGLVLLGRDCLDGQSHGRVRHVRHYVQALIEPLPGDAGADVGLVLVVGLDHLGPKAARSRKVLHRLPGVGDRRRPGRVAVSSGQVGEHAEAEGASRL